MEQIEIMSWKTLDALKQAATHIEEIIGDLDTHEQMAVFCSIEEDFLELYYTELESNYLRRFDDEEEMLKYIELRKNEFGDNDYETVDYYDEDIDYEDEEDEEEEDDEYDGFKIDEEGEEDDF